MLKSAKVEMEWPVAPPAPPKMAQDCIVQGEKKDTVNMFFFSSPSNTIN